MVHSRHNFAYVMTHVPPLCGRSTERKVGDAPAPVTDLTASQFPPLTYFFTAHLHLIFGGWGILFPDQCFSALLLSLDA